MAMLDDTLATALLNVFPRLTGVEQRISVALYKMLAEGQPVAPRVLAARLGLPLAEVAQALGDWYGVYYDAAGCVIGYWGLALGAMKHRFQVNGQSLYTWCAWDTLFLPQILGAVAEVESGCAMTGDVIRLTVSAHRVEIAQPESTVISIVTPERAEVEKDIVRNFCHYVHFFRSPAAAEDWISRHAGTCLLTLDQAWALGREKNLAQYGETLALQA